VTASGLIDTGAILALLHEDDHWHERCLAAFSDIAVPLATSAAVLTEVFHLVGRGHHRVSRAWTFVRSGAVTYRIGARGRFRVVPER
jgi:predicted nucleic acid-binding protein